jgi:hypothetical protein
MAKAIYLYGLILFAFANAQVEVRVQPREVLLGQHFSVTYAVPFDKEAEFRSQPGNNAWRGFYLHQLDSGLTQSAATPQYYWRYTLAVFDTGTHIIPPRMFLRRHNAKIDTLFAAAQVMFAVTAKPDSITTIHPAASISVMALPLYYYLILVTVLLGAYFLWRYWVKKRSREWRHRPYFRPAEPIAKQVRRRLDNLGKMTIREAADKHYFYFELTSILRLAIADLSTRLAAQEMTTRELKEALPKDNRFADDALALIAILEYADQVKFARFSPRTDAHKSHLQSISEIVLRHYDQMLLQQTEVNAGA